MGEKENNIENGAGSGSSSQEREIISSLPLLEHPEEQVEEKKFGLLDVLKMVSPGTVLRVAIDDIVRARTGAIIVVDSPVVQGIIEGGFRVNCKLTSQRLAELSKMDGAIILSEDMKKVLYANVLLVPDYSISTNETGTRHKAAERTAKQANTLVIAISERRNKVTVYCGGIRYVLKSTEELMRRATETLNILEKQKEIYSELLTNLNILEVTGLVAVSDVCAILQRVEMILKIENIIKRDIVELGNETVIVRMRLRELTKNIEKERTLILRDYAKGKLSRAKQILENLTLDGLLDMQSIARLIFEASLDEQISPRGFRLLSKTDLGEKEISQTVKEFGSLNKVFSATPEEISRVLKSELRVESFVKEISNLKEQIMVGKKV